MQLSKLLYSILYYTHTIRVVSNFIIHISLSAARSLHQFTAKVVVPFSSFIHWFKAFAVWHNRINDDTRLLEFFFHYKTEKKSSVKSSNSETGNQTTNSSQRRHVKLLQWYYITIPLFNRLPSVSVVIRHRAAAVATAAAAATTVNYVIINRRKNIWRIFPKLNTVQRCSAFCVSRTHTQNIIHTHYSAGWLEIESSVRV